MAKGNWMCFKDGELDDIAKSLFVAFSLIREKYSGVKMCGEGWEEARPFLRISNEILYYLLRFEEKGVIKLPKGLRPIPIDLRVEEL